MKKIMLFLFLLLMIPDVIFANGYTSFIDVKIGKTYEIFEKLDISSDTNLALYQNFPFHLPKYPGYYKYLLYIYFGFYRMLD